MHLDEGRISMALSYKEPQQPRRIGMRTERLRYGSLLQNGPHANPKPRAQKQRSPSIDVDAPPKDSSDEASTVHSVELSDTELIPSKKRKIGYYEQWSERLSKSPQSRGNDATSELLNEPSRYRPSTFTASGRSRGLNHSQKGFKLPSQAARTVAIVEAEDPIDSWTTKPKSKAKYGMNLKNIHTAVSPRKEKEDEEENKVSAMTKNRSGFRALNSKAIEPLCKRI